VDLSALQVMTPVDFVGRLNESGELAYRIMFVPFYNLPPPGESFTGLTGAHLLTPNGYVNAVRPKHLPTKMQDVVFAGTKYHLEGENVPVLTVEVNPYVSVYFEHYIMLWKHPTVQIGVKNLSGMFKRMMAGLQVFVTEATGNGSIAFSRDGSGQIIALHMGPGQEYKVREHQFLAATGNVAYSYQRVNGFVNMFYGNSGYFIDSFKALKGEGILWLHGYGNVFNKYLAPGEQIEVEPGGWIYMDGTVKMETNCQNLASGLLGSFNFITNKFTGPGNVGIQSMYLHFPTAV